ncbi:hypothetical protein M409DRAFT_54796 [Zasmidium cellare ATCC 36951]|uniref:Uncharacterized protein n=1 Tax=Zasmidium cellare ATCC 36951 TaxID=1080233 RepID=A0A6A6CJS5_ZASCE|nr:uncharacterized protein M409DRAFT_54796 [Zasmidium cellare ATCC 36951]KAF2166448.1 hypothetical protein M409DRAFT_54796 [Zasmidium cellare ATCC 36951]
MSLIECCYTAPRFRTDFGDAGPVMQTRFNEVMWIRGRMRFWGNVLIGGTVVGCWASKVYSQRVEVNMPSVGKVQDVKAARRIDLKVTSSRVVPATLATERLVYSYRGLHALNGDVSLIDRMGPEGGLGEERRFSSLPSPSVQHTLISHALIDISFTHHRSFIPFITAFGRPPISVTSTATPPKSSFIMARQRLSQKFSMKNLKSVFKKDRNNSDSESDYEEDHLVPRLRRAASRLSLRSETRENTRRNSQISTSEERHRLRSRNSVWSFRLPLGMDVAVTRPSAGVPPGQDMESSEETGPRTRNRASTLATDSEGHVQEYRGEWYTAPPPSGVHPALRDPPQPRFMARNDSVPHAQEDYEEYDEDQHEEPAEEVVRSPSPTGSAGSNNTIRQRSSTPAPRPPTPPVHRSRHDDSGYYSRGSRTDPSTDGRPSQTMSKSDRRTSQLPLDLNRRRSQNLTRIPTRSPSAAEGRPSQPPLDLNRHPSQSHLRTPTRNPSTAERSQYDNSSIIDLYANRRISSSTTREQSHGSISHADTAPAATSKAAGKRPVARGSGSGSGSGSGTQDSGTQDPTATSATTSPHPDAMPNTATTTTPPASTSTSQPPPQPHQQPYEARAHPLRRMRAVQFREPPERPSREPERPSHNTTTELSSHNITTTSTERPSRHTAEQAPPQPMNFPAPIPAHDFDVGRFLWRVGAEMCRQVEREELEALIAASREGEGEDQDQGRDERTRRDERRDG